MRISLCTSIGAGLAVAGQHFRLSRRGPPDVNLSCYLGRLHNPALYANAANIKMSQRVFVKVVGFSDVERHALNTVFRLSEDHDTAYCLWMPDAPEAPGLALIDGQSYESGFDRESPSRQLDLKTIWVGEGAPPDAWRVFARPIYWPNIVQAMDSLYGAPPELDFDLDSAAAPEPALDLDLDFDLGGPEDAPDTQPADPGPPAKRALIIAAARDDRLYMRARLSLADLTQADDAASAAEALELMRAQPYAVALVDFNLPDVDGWDFVRQLVAGKAAIAHVIVLTPFVSLPDRYHAWRSGVTACLAKPPDPERLRELLSRV